MLMTNTTDTDSKDAVLLAFINVLDSSGGTTVLEKYNDEEAVLIQSGTLSLIVEAADHLITITHWIPASRPLLP